MYDVIVIGSGTGGYVSAIRGAQNGLRTIIIEAREIGGTCLNRGCIPTKALIGSVEILHKAKNSKNFGVNIDSINYDWSFILSRKEQIVKKLTGGIEFLLKKNNVDVIKGFAYIKDSNNVIVIKENKTEENLQTKNIIVATGSEPLDIPAFNIDHSIIINSDDALNIKKIPKSIVIIGSGAIGLEFATIFNALGVKTDVIEMFPDIIPEFNDKKVKRIMALGLKKAGVSLHTDEKVESVKINNSNEGVVETDKGNIYKSEVVLVAIGRKTNVDILVNAGVSIDNNFVKVNSRMQTNIRGVYAVGDITGGPLLAHKAEFEGIVAADSIAGKSASREDFKNIPVCIFTIPPLAICGYTEEEAINNGMDVKTGEFNYSANGKALSIGAASGLCKVVIDKDSNNIIGAQIYGESADIMISEASVLIKKGINTDEFVKIIHPHPTLGEIFMESVHDSIDESIHKFKVR